MKPYIHALSFLLFSISLAQTARGGSTNPIASVPKVVCSDENTCTVKFQTGNGKTQSYDLATSSSIFSEGAKVKALGREFVARDLSDRTQFSSKSKTSAWGTARLRGKGTKKTFSSGIFRTLDGDLLQWKEQNGIITGESPAPVKMNDIAFPLPAGIMPPISPDTRGFDTNSRETNSSDTNASDSDPGDTNPAGITPFFPNCYPQDNLERTFKIGLAIDYGVFLSYASGLPQNSPLYQTVALQKTIAALEDLVAAVRLIYLLQLNGTIEVAQVIVGNANSPAPINAANSQGTCMQAIGAFNSFQFWKSQHPDTDHQVGVWMLVSNCFQGIAGVSYVGSFGGVTGNACVAQNNWLVFAHEMGHSIGASHTFMNGVGTTGGIMDYGDGRYPFPGGPVQFHPENRGQICPTLAYLVNSSSPAFPARTTGTCGDGVMSANEQCECLQLGSQKCGACVGCKLTKPRACSSSLFVMRHPNSEDFVSATPSELDDSKCCSAKGKLAGPKTTCNNGLDACSAYGKCTPTCTNLLGWGTPNCGFDAAGCVMGCIYQGRCQFNISYKDPTTNLPKWVGQVPDGTACWRKKNVLGHCGNAKCGP